MNLPLLLLCVLLYSSIAISIVVLVANRVLVPLRRARSSSGLAYNPLTRRWLYICACLSAVVGLTSRNLYLAHSIKQLEALPEGSSAIRWAVGPLLTEVADHVFGSGVRYMLGLQGYLALLAWSVYMGIAGLLLPLYP